MNVFVLDTNPVLAAKMHCDKHVPKMIVESAQMLSTAHRMLDGTMIKQASKSGKTTVKYYKLNDKREDILYKAVHMNHPCTVWTRESIANYDWHYRLFVALCRQFRIRYEKDHATDLLLRDFLKEKPRNIPVIPMTPFPLAMKSEPQCMDPNDPVKSYREFYQTKQARFKMEWKKVPTPKWFQYA